MSFLKRLFGDGYKDAELVNEAEQAILQDPMVKSANKVGVFSEEGVLTLAGTVESNREKSRIEDLVRGAVENSNLKFERIKNQLNPG